MTKEDIVLKLKKHLDEEQHDAKVYYDMAKEAKEMGDKKLTRLLSCLAYDEVCHRKKIRDVLEENGLATDEEDNEQAEFLMFQLKKL